MNAIDRDPTLEGILYEPENRQPPAWHGKRAPTGLKTYPAWATAPRPAAERPAPRSYAGLVLGMVTLGAVAIWAAWWLR